jgi:hypothetical protein
MAMQQPATLRVVSAGNIVEAEWMPSGVPGLALVGRPVSTGWRLVHVASGRAVSRSAEHFDPEAVRALAKIIAPLADWTDPDVAASRPHLREELDRILAGWLGHTDTRPRHVRREFVDDTRLLDLPTLDTPSLDTRPHATPGAVGAEMGSATGPERRLDGGDRGRGLAEELQNLVERVRSAEYETAVLREVMRRLREVVPPATFDQALSTLSASDRGLVGSLVPDGTAADATGVVQAIRPEVDTIRTQPATPGRSPTTRVPPTTRSGRAPGPDIAAS